MTNVHIADDDLELVIDALRYKAWNEAGQTQTPQLCKPHDYEEWDLAAKLEKTLARSRTARARHEQQ